MPRFDQIARNAAALVCTVLLSTTLVLGAVGPVGGAHATPAASVQQMA